MTTKETESNQSQSDLEMPKPTAYKSRPFYQVTFQGYHRYSGTLDQCSEWITATHAPLTVASVLRDPSWKLEAIR